jgi:hypothetical protein
VTTRVSNTDPRAANRRRRGPRIPALLVGDPRGLGADPPRRVARRAPPRRTRRELSDSRDPVPGIAVAAQGGNRQPQSPERFHIGAASFQPVRAAYVRKVLLERLSTEPAGKRMLVVGAGAACSLRARSARSRGRCRGPGSGRGRPRRRLPGARADGAIAVDDGNPCRVHTERGTVTGQQVVVATHYPLLDRGLFFARLEPTRSYVIAARVRGAVPRGMSISAGGATRSVRSQASCSSLAGRGTRPAREAPAPSATGRSSRSRASTGTSRQSPTAGRPGPGQLGPPAVLTLPETDNSTDWGDTRRVSASRDCSTFGALFTTAM